MMAFRFPWQHKEQKHSTFNKIHSHPAFCISTHFSLLEIPLNYQAYSDLFYQPGILLLSILPPKKLLQGPAWMPYISMKTSKLGPPWSQNILFTYLRQVLGRAWGSAFLTIPIYADASGPGTAVWDSLQEMFVEWISDWINANFPLKNPISKGPKNEL